MRESGRATLLIAAAMLAGAAATAPAGATAAETSDLAVTPLERAAFVAAPAVYDLRAGVQIDALLVGGRRLPVRRRVPVRGTAFGVAPGRVVAARHVLVPAQAQLIEDAIDAAQLSGIPTDQTRVRAIVRLPRSVSLTRPRVAGAAGDSASTITARVRLLSEEVTDLALLEIDDLDAPTLALDDTLTRGTPVALIGFGGQPRSVPAVRLGTLDGPRLIFGTDNDGFGGFDGEVLRGDSGAPVVDAFGQAHGVVLRRRTNTAPVVARAETVRDLLEADGATGGESAATTDFRTAMAAFWRRDYRSAAASLELLRDADPGAALVRDEHGRATALADADYALRAPSRARGVILAVGAMATLSAAALGAVRIRRQPLLP
jgi:hypothetical protein